MPETGGSLNKKFITIFVFFGLFATLLATMPAQFREMGVTASSQDKEATEFFSSHNVTVYNNTQPINITFGTTEEFDWGLPAPEQIQFWWDVEPGIPWPGEVLEVRHLRKIFLGYWYGWHRLKVQEPYLSNMQYPSLPQFMTEEDVVTNFWDAEANASYVELKGEIVTMKLFIATSNQSWTLQESWDNNELAMYSTYNIDWSETSTGAWGVLMQMLTFQSPTFGLTGVFGSIISIMITLSLWGSIALIAFAIITALLPFVSGWGGD